MYDISNLRINNDRHNGDASLNVKVVHKGFASCRESAVPYWILLSTPRHGFTFYLSPLVFKKRPFCLCSLQAKFCDWEHLDEWGIFYCSAQFHAVWWLRTVLFFLWHCYPTRVMASSFLRFLDHTQRRNTVGRIPLDKWSARSRDLYLKTHNTHNRQIPMPPVGFEPTISAGERPQTYALDRAATGTCKCCNIILKCYGTTVV